MIRRFTLALALLLAACGANPALAASVDATPATFASVIASAKAGDVVVLMPGEYRGAAIVKRTWSPPLAIDASLATFTNPTGYALKLTGVHGLSVAGGTYTRAKRGIVMDGVTDVRIIGPLLTGLQTDGIDVAASQRVLIHSATCENFAPLPGDHPDCIQLWSVAGRTPTADVTVKSSTATGAMQGINGFNHVRNGVDDGGFDRITFTGNTVAVTYSQGIGLYDCRMCIVTENKATSLGKAWTQITAPRCTKCTVARNTIGPRPPR